MHLKPDVILGDIIAGIKNNRVGFIAKNASDQRVVATVLGAPAFLIGLTDVEIDVVKSQIANRVDPELVAAKDETLKALAEAKRGWRSAADQIRERVRAEVYDEAVVGHGNLPGESRGARLAGPLAVQNAGRAFGSAGLRSAAMGFGAFMADNSFSNRIVIQGRAHSLPRPLPMRYLRTALVARGFWDGWKVTRSAPRRFHFLGLGAPIMIPLSGPCGARHPSPHVRRHEPLPAMPWRERSTQPLEHISRSALAGSPSSLCRARVTRGSLHAASAASSCGSILLTMCADENGERLALVPVPSPQRTCSHRGNFTGPTR